MSEKTDGPVKKLVENQFLAERLIEKSTLEKVPDVTERLHPGLKNNNFQNVVRGRASSTVPRAETRLTVYRALASTGVGGAEICRYMCRYMLRYVDKCRYM